MRYASTAVPTSASATAAPSARSTPVHVRASRRAASAWADTTRAYVASISRSSASSTRSPRTRLGGRSEEHTSELQSLAYLVCRLLLEKKKKQRMQRRRTGRPHTHQAGVGGRL